MTRPLATGRASTTSARSGAPPGVASAADGTGAAGWMDRGIDTNTPTSTPMISVSAAVVMVNRRVIRLSL